MGNGPFMIEELYGSLGIYHLPPLERQRLINLIAKWRVYYKTEDGRLGSDLFEYPDAEADLDTMAQKFLDHERNGQIYWRYDNQKVRYDENADEIRRLLARVFFQKNLNAARNARKTQKAGEKCKSNNIAPEASDVAVSHATQSQGRSGPMCSNNLGRCESTISDNSYEPPRRSNRKRTPSKKRQKIAHPQVKPNRICNRCRKHHSKCDGAQRCVRCTKSGKPCVYGTLASPAGLKSEDDTTTHSEGLGPVAGLASNAPSPAPEPAATAASSPAATRTDLPAQWPAETSEPELTRLPTSSWERELVPLPEDNTVEDLTHRQGGNRTGGKGKHHPEGAYQKNTDTEAHNTDQTPKPKVKIIYIIITEDHRGKKIKRCWRNGSLSGKSLGEVFQEAEKLVGRGGTKQIDFELEGLNTMFPIPVGDEESFECMRDEFNTETKERRKKGCWKFKIWLTLKGGKDLANPQIDNPIDEQGHFEDIF